MGKYVKIPVEVEAWQIPEDDGETREVPSWLVDALLSGAVKTHEFGGAPGLRIMTLEGVMRGNVGDYVIRGVEGELYPCKTSVFEKTYRKVG